MKTTISRRAFLRQTAVAGAAIGFPAVVRAANLNSRLHLAAVGTESRGYTDMENFATHPKVQYVALCDVDRTKFTRAAALFPEARHFRDFREMFVQLGDRLDAVNVATPDHMHALPSIEAMRRGKHVWCQKPLTHTVWEARQMSLWAKRAGVITQMGNQIHSSVEYRMATRLIRDGVIGRVKEVHSWCSITGNERTRLLEPPPPGPVPPELDWNLWIGGAPMRDYAPEAYHPRRWRDWQDFGGGVLGDFGCHILDPVFTALGLNAPLSVVADNSGINRHVWPTMETVRYVFPGNDWIAGPTLTLTLTLTWTDGGLRPPRKLAQMPDNLDLPGNGSLFIGERGNMLLRHVGRPRLFPDENFKGFAYPKDFKGLSHWHVWIDAILAGQPTSDGFDYAGPLTETVQLGNVATRVVRRPTNAEGKHLLDVASDAVLRWDAKNLRIPNDAEANALVTKAYRPGWEVSAA